jgi:dihydrolipoamide dehydrogenase
MSKKTDVLVIGGGPGGYPAAIRARQLGKKVILIDKGSIGGECVNWGCIPSKALISAADFYYKIKNESSILGITAKDVKIDMKTLQKWKNHVKDRIVSGVKTLLIGNKIETVIGTARFLSKNEIEVKLKDGSTETIEAVDIIIATGTTFRSLPGFAIDNRKILSARGALNLNEIPEEIVCIGGGIISIELGTVFAKLGSKVKVVEILSDIIYGVDESLIAILKEKLTTKLGVEIFTESKVVKTIEKENGKLELEVEKNDKEIIKLTADKILLAVGKVSTVSELDLENAGVKTSEKGFILTDLQQKTNVPHIYAVGDCTGMPFLAHRATKQGIIAAEVIAGYSSEADFRAMPGAIFTDPEIAYAGMNEHEAKAAGYEIISAKAPFSVSGRALTQLDEDGYVNVIVEAKTGVLLGVQIIGPHASDLISEAALALEMGATAEDVGLTVHPHPTLPEMIMEAVEAAMGKATNVANVKTNNK